MANTIVLGGTSGIGARAAATLRERRHEVAVVPAGQPAPGACDHLIVALNSDAVEAWTDEARFALESNLLAQVDAAGRAARDVRCSITFVTGGKYPSQGALAIRDALAAAVQPLARELKPVRVNAVATPAAVPLAVESSLMTGAVLGAMPVA